MSAQGIEKRLAQLEQVQPAVRLDFSKVPSDELQNVLVIFARHGMQSYESTRQASPETLEAAHGEVMEACPNVRAAYEKAVRGSGYRARDQVAWCG